MYSAALLSGTDLLRLGEGFSGSAGDSELPPNLRGRRTGSFGWDAGDAEGSGAAKAEPVRSSDREGSEALAADTAGTG